MPHVRVSSPHIALAFCIVALAAACSSDSGPRHPHGTVESTLPLSGRPFGVAISGSGTVFVGRQDADSVSPAAVTAFLFTKAVPVGNDPGDLTFAPNGAKAYVSNFNDATVGILNVSTKTQTGAIPVGSSAYAVIVSPDGATLYVSTASSGLKRFGTASLAVLPTIATNGQGNGLAFGGSGAELYQSSLAGLTVQVINTTTGTIRKTIPVGLAPQGIAISPDGSQLWVADEVAGLQLYSLPTGDSLSTIPGTAGAFGLAMTPDGVQLYVTRSAPGIVSIVDRASRTVVDTIIAGKPRHVAFSADGLHAVVADEILGAILIN